MSLKLFYIFCYMLSGTLAIQMRNWDYVMLDVFSNTTDESKLKIDLSVVRIGRGDYALSGSLTVGVDIDDDYFIEVLIYRSASGNSQFKLHPFKVQKQTMPEFMANFYRNSVAKSLVDCSNAPQADGIDPPALRKDVYNLDKCMLSTDGLPSHMQPGYYKVQAIATGPVICFLEFLIEVETKM